MAAADVNVAELLNNAENQTYIDQLKEAIGKNEVVAKALEVAETAEEVYSAVKDYIKIKLEDFKVCFEKTISFYKESKSELSDEVMEAVSGGGWWSNFWNKHKAGIITAAIFVGCVAVVGVAGLAMGAFIGEVAVGITTGLTVGFAAGGIAAIGYANAKEHVF